MTKRTPRPKPKDDDCPCCGTALVTVCVLVGGLMVLWLTYAIGNNSGYSDGYNEGYTTGKLVVGKP